jgi:hypothetical protein
MDGVTDSTQTYTDTLGRKVQVSKDGDNTVVSRDDFKNSIYSSDGGVRTSIPLSDNQNNISIYTNAKNKLDGIIVLNDTNRDNQNVYSAKDCAPVDTTFTKDNYPVYMSDDKNGNRVAEERDLDGNLIKKTTFGKTLTGENVSATQVDSNFGTYMNDQGSLIGLQLKGKDYYDIQPLDKEPK